MSKEITAAELQKLIGVNKVALPILPMKARGGGQGHAQVSFRLVRAANKWITGSKPKWGLGVRNRGGHYVMWDVDGKPR